MDQRRDYEHHFMRRYPTTYNEVRDTNLSSCYSALNKLIRQMDNVNDNYVQLQQRHGQGHGAITSIYNSLLSVDAYIDSFNKKGTVFHYYCPLNEKREFVKHLKQLFINSEYIHNYKQYRNDARFHGHKRLKTCFNMYNMIKNKMNALVN